MFLKTFPDFTYLPEQSYCAVNVLDVYKHVYVLMGGFFDDHQERR